MRKGISLIEVILAIGIVVMLFGGIYTAYIGILDAIQNSELRNAAAGVLNRKVEIIRNLPYASVGVVGGIPSGVLPAQENTTSTMGTAFTVKTVVRNIDDPFDGVLGGAPNDTSPADYKLVELEVSCPTCIHFIPLVLTTTASPKNLEGPTSGGSLFINVFNAGGQPVQDATVHITNASVTPAIDLTDTTNANGVLQLVGVPTSTQGYRLEASKQGYSSERTYPIGGQGNPNPVKPDANVAAQTITEISFSIDTVSTMHIAARNNVCVPIGGQAVSVKGAKLIGTSPNVLKFSTSSALDASGNKTYGNLEWDTYTVSVSTSSYALAGIFPLQPVTLNPASAIDAFFTLASSSVRSLMVAVKDAAAGSGITDAIVQLSAAGGYSKTLTTGRSVLTHTDWSGGAYLDQSGMDAESTSGILTMAGPPYSTSTTAWLVSETFDIGGASSTFYTVSWSPASTPGGTSMKFQLASNNDNATWNYVGPDGTGGSYYTTSGAQISGGHSGNRYLRYKVFMSTTDAGATPSLDDIEIEFNGPCVPPAHAFFANLGAGTYTLTVDAVGYLQATSSVVIGGGWQEKSVSLTH